MKENDGSGIDSEGSVHLDGSTIELNAGGGILTGGATTIRGLVINRVGRIPILLAGGDNVIEGNYIGTNVAGSAGSSNGFGVEVSSSNNRIGGANPAARNVISFNNGAGIRLAPGANGNHIVGNFIGTNAAGSAGLGNQFSGISATAIDATGNASEVSPCLALQ